MLWILNTIKYNNINKFIIHYHSRIWDSEKADYDFTIQNFGSLLINTSFLGIVVIVHEMEIEIALVVMFCM